MEFIENKNILIQEYNKNKFEFKDNDILVTIRFIDFANWKINEPIELFVSRETTFIEFADMITKHYPNLYVREFKIID